jgi:hypothetical protein
MYVRAYIRRKSRIEEDGSNNPSPPPPPLPFSSSPCSLSKNSPQDEFDTGPHPPFPNFLDLNADAASGSILLSTFLKDAANPLEGNDLFLSHLQFNLPITTRLQLLAPQGDFL